MKNLLLLPACLALLALASAPPAQASYRTSAQMLAGQAFDPYYGSSSSQVDQGVQWTGGFQTYSMDQIDGLVGQTNASDGQPTVNGFFDWFTDLFDWFNDKKDEVTGNKYDDAGIPHDAFQWSYYGMNVQQVDTMSVADFEKTLRYSGPWIRFSISTDEVAENNWYRLQPGLSKIRQAGNNTGIAPNVVINLTGYSNASSGDEYLLSGLSWSDKANRYHNLAYSLVNKVRSLGWGDVIYEAWNEPDHGVYGIGVSAGTSAFTDGLTSLLNGFSSGVRQAGGTTAFSPFMTLNDSKIDTVRTVWNKVQSGFDYFSAHEYDDDAGKAKYYAQQTKGFTGNRPVLITEHGYQSSPHDYDKYRRQAWALYQGFGADVLRGVMGYVYGSNHQPWVIDANDDFFWKVTHDSKP